MTLAYIDAEIDEMVKPYLSQIGSTPELLSVLDEIDLIPEQIASITNAKRFMAICELWKCFEAINFTHRL